MLRVDRRTYSITSVTSIYLRLNGDWILRKNKWISNGSHHPNSLLQGCQSFANLILLRFSGGQCPHYRLAVVTCSRSAAKRLCVTSCGPSFYLTADKKECRLCSDNCTTCVGTASTCTSCNNTNVLHKSKCIESCPDGYFIHLENKRCERCSDKCKTCLDGWTDDSCSSCNRPYYLRKCAWFLSLAGSLDEVIAKSLPLNLFLLHGAWGNVHSSGHIRYSLG